jgi:hypothetical protein
MTDAMPAQPCDWKSQYWMMVTGASAGPMEKSAPLTGGKRDAESGTGVASVVMLVQLNAGVGVFGMTGFKTVMGVGVMSVSGVGEAQALRANSATTISDSVKKVRFIY